MSMAPGANLRNMNENWGWPVFYNEEFSISIPALADKLGRPGAIVGGEPDLSVSVAGCRPNCAITRHD
jgi:hypothetical protein